MKRFLRVAMVSSAMLLSLISTSASAQDPVAFWQMDEAQWSGEPGEVEDSSGNGNDGTARTAGYSGSLPNTVDANVCQGGRFRGEGFLVPEENNTWYQARHYVEVPDSNELSPLATTREMSISGWVRLDNRSGTKTFVHKGAGEEQEYNVRLQDGRPELTVWNVYGGSSSLSMNYQMTEGRWYFLNAQALRHEEYRWILWPIWGEWDYSVDFQLILFDENGNVVASNSRTDESSFTGNYTNKAFNQPLIIGGTRWNGDPTNFLDGTLDELYIHDANLSRSQIQELARNTRPCFSEPLNCFSDDYSGGMLSEDWVTSVSRGPFTPQIVNGRLRMTQDATNQATAVTYQRKFPGADNLIRVEFDYYAYDDSSGADGMAVVFSDAAITPQAGGYGGSLGYAQEPDGSGGFAGGWLGIGIDEYGNFSNDSEGREGGNNGRTLDSVAVRGAAPDYEYIADSGELTPGIDAVDDNNPHRYRITIDSRGGITPILTVERRGPGTGSSFELLIQETLSSQPEIPENLFFSLTGSTGASTNIHEMDNLQVCAYKVGEIEALVDHFEIEHGGSGLTCSPASVTIRACDNADCSQLFPGPVEVNMTPTGWVGGDAFTFTGQTSHPLRVTSPGDVTLGVPGSTPGARAFSQTLCDDGSGTLSADNCEMTFYDSGFDIAIPDHVADTEVQATIAAVRKDDVTQECVPGFSNETRAVALWSDYVNPDAGTLNVWVDGDEIPTSQGETTNLTFDADGVATETLRYPDAGKVRLHAQYNGTGEEAGLVMEGNGDFVARPDHFELEIPDNPAAEAVEDGNDFVAAGADFEIRVKAINASGDRTPNFGQESAPESVVLASSLVAPTDSDAVSPDMVGEFGDFAKDCEGQSATAGTACGQFQWPEVGIISLTPSLANSAYLGTLDVVGDAVPYVGRFIPDRFDVVVTEPGEVQPYCSAAAPFAYTGQALAWDDELEPRLRVEALNVAGAVTRNYTFGDFRRLAVADFLRTPGTVDEVAQDANGQPLSVSATLEDGSLTTLSPGRMQYAFASADEIAYVKSPVARVPAFTPDYRIELTGLTDADGVSSTQLPVAVEPEFPLEMRYGRLQMDNAFGPESSNLIVPFRAQYYTANGFITNTDDSCWSYATGTDVALDQSGLSGGSTAVDGATGTLNAGLPGAGNELVLTAPGEPNQGDVRATFTVPDWLRDDFDGDGSLEDPSGLATFGVYRGNDHIIYWREL